MIRLLLCLSLICFCRGLANNCTYINWVQHSTAVSGFTKYLAKVAADFPVQNLLKVQDPYPIPGHMLPSGGRFSFAKQIIYDFNLKVQLKQFKLAGFSKFKFSPATVLPNGDLKLTLLFDKLDLNGLVYVALHQSTQSGCSHLEEQYLGLCYKKCSLLTRGTHPRRTATNTCTTNGCASQRKQNDAGLCYPWCRPKFKGVGPVCWGECHLLYGSEYKDTGLTCHRWWLPHTQIKPSYGRGVGTLPYAPWTSGFGCNGFGVNGGGHGCASPYWKICFLDGLKLKHPGQCGPIGYSGNVGFKLVKPTVDIIMKVDAPLCTGPAPPGEDVSPKIACIIRSLLYAVMGALNPSGAQASIAHLNSLKSKISRVTLNSLKLQYAPGSQPAFSFSSNNINGLVLNGINSVLKTTIENRMNTLLNGQLLNGAIKTAANKAIDRTLANNRCR